MRPSEVKTRPEPRTLTLFKSDPARMLTIQGLTFFIAATLSDPSLTLISSRVLITKGAETGFKLYLRMIPTVLSSGITKRMISHPLIPPIIIDERTTNQMCFLVISLCCYLPWRAQKGDDNYQACEDKMKNDLLEAEVMK